MSDRTALEISSPKTNENVCVCVCVRARAHSVTKSCLTRCNPMDCSPPGSSVHGTF